MTSSLHSQEGPPEALPPTHSAGRSAGAEARPPAPKAQLAFGTAAWKTKSVMSRSVLFTAWMVITVTLGLVLERSKAKSIFSPFLL